MKHVPNALTLLRLVLAPVIAWLYLMGTTTLQSRFPELGVDVGKGTTYLAVAVALFVVAALTDLFDGMIARAFNAHSKFGRIIDPIADKALVGLPLIAIVWTLIQVADSEDVAVSPLVLTIAFAVFVIVGRDVAMTWIRLSSPDGEGARVSSLAKIKTALELFVVGAYLLMSAIKPYVSGAFLYDLFAMALWIWIALLVITAALSAYTALQYLRPKR